MQKSIRQIILSLVLLSSTVLIGIFPANAASSPVRAVDGIVQGNVQKVGFRAFIFRLAIRYNLGGTIENLQDGSVHFALQGLSTSMDETLAAIRQGPAKALVNSLKVKNTAIQNNVTSVTVKGWTSVQRNFEHPVDLVYPLRKNSQPITKPEAYHIYKEIIRKAMA